MKKVLLLALIVALLGLIPFAVAEKNRIKCCFLGGKVISDCRSCR